jgi:hypothetical protein
MSMATLDLSQCPAVESVPDRQQNLKGRRIAVIVIGNPTWRVLRKHLHRVAAAVDAAPAGSYAEVKIPY